LRLRGRVDGRKLVPYYSRAEIEREPSPLAGVELVWVDNAVESFFLHIQGSGRVRFDDGTLVRMGYADQNGHPYRSLGRALIDAGELSAEDATMQGIKAWAEKNSARQREFLWRNPSYVFFRELPASEDGPIGSLGVPLSAGRSVAIDARLLPLGAPVYLATTWPGAETPLRRLMLAQDTGGAIRGAPRADFFWGAGAEAGDFAGRMRQSGAMWVLLPREHPLARGAR
jgi:membrane-bound lytic murein transglycosylase A